jgi:hypothetical protein
VNQIVQAQDSTLLAGTLQLHREGFHFTRFNGRELKNGNKTVSIAMSNAPDKKAIPAKKIADLTVADLEALLAQRKADAKEAGSAVVEIQATSTPVLEEVAS